MRFRLLRLGVGSGIFVLKHPQVILMTSLVYEWLRHPLTKSIKSPTLGFEMPSVRRARTHALKGCEILALHTWQ